MPLYRQYLSGLSAARPELDTFEAGLPTLRAELDWVTTDHGFCARLPQITALTPRTDASIPLLVIGIVLLLLVDVRLFVLLLVPLVALLWRRLRGPLTPRPQGLRVEIDQRHVHLDSHRFPRAAVHDAVVVLRQLQIAVGDESWITAEIPEQALPAAQLLAAELRAAHRDRPRAVVGREPVDPDSVWAPPR